MACCTDLLGVTSESVAKEYSKEYDGTLTVDQEARKATIQWNAGQEITLNSGGFPLIYLCKINCTSPQFLHSQRYYVNPSPGSFFTVQTVNANITYPSGDLNQDRVPKCVVNIGYPLPDDVSPIPVGFLTSEPSPKCLTANYPEGYKNVSLFYITAEVLNIAFSIEVDWAEQESSLTTQEYHISMVRV